MTSSLGTSEEDDMRKSILATTFSIVQRTIWRSNDSWDDMFPTELRNKLLYRTLQKFGGGKDDNNR
jgi:hypothetical protein